MAGTEDIAEKVADVLLEQTSKTAAFVMDNVPDIIDGVVRDAGGIMKTIFEKAKEGTTTDKLRQLEEQGAKLKLAQFWGMAKKLNMDTDTMKIADVDNKDFEKLLRKEGMVFSALDSTTDDYTVYVFFRKDAEKVQSAYKALMAQRGKIHELQPEMFINTMEPEKLTVLENVDPVQAELFRYFAKEHGLVFTHLPENEKRSGQILYQPKDADKARKVLLSVGWALTCEDGAKIRQQVQRYLKGRNAINRAIEDGEKELYILSNVNPGHAVRITSQEMALYKNGKVIDTMDRAAPDFYTRCMASCMAIPNAVVLTGEEFNDPSITPETLQKMPTMDLFPPDTVEVTEDGYVNNLYDGFDPVREQTRINELYHLVSMKMSLDNEGNAGWGTFNSSVSFSEFAGYEHYRDNEEREGREADFEHFKKAAFYGEKNFNPTVVDMNDRNIDYIISRAYSRAGIRPEPEQEARTHEAGAFDR